MLRKRKLALSIPPNAKRLLADLERCDGKAWDGEDGKYKSSVTNDKGMRETQVFDVINGLVFPELESIELIPNKNKIKDKYYLNKDKTRCGKADVNGRYDLLCGWCFYFNRQGTTRACFPTEEGGDNNICKDPD